LICFKAFFKLFSLFPTDQTLPDLWHVGTGSAPLKWNSPGHRIQEGEHWAAVRRMVAELIEYGDGDEGGSLEKAFRAKLHRGSFQIKTNGLKTNGIWSIRFIAVSFRSICLYFKRTDKWEPRRKSMISQAPAKIWPSLGSDIGLKFIKYKNFARNIEKCLMKRIDGQPEKFKKRYKLSKFFPDVLHVRRTTTGTGWCALRVFLTITISRT